MAKIINDVDMPQIKRIFDVLATDSPALSKYCTPADIEELLKVLKVCDFKKGDCICRKNEPIDMVGIVCFG